MTRYRFSLLVRLYPFGSALPFDSTLGWDSIGYRPD